MDSNEFKWIDRLNSIWIWNIQLHVQRNLWRLCQRGILFPQNLCDNGNKTEYPFGQKSNQINKIVPTFQCIKIYRHSTMGFFNYIAGMFRTFYEQSPYRRLLVLIQSMFGLSTADNEHLKYESDSNWFR